MGQNYQKGDVVEVNLGNPPKEIKGHEQGFIRPCVIIKAFNNLEIAVIVPCSTKEPRYSLYTIVKILKGIGAWYLIVMPFAIRLEQFLLIELLKEEDIFPRMTFSKSVQYFLMPWICNKILLLPQK